MKKTKEELSKNAKERASKRLPKSSQYRGVTRDKQMNKWRAYIRKPSSMDPKRTKITIGLFDLEEDAAKAYDEKAKELYGLLAELNFKTL